MKSKIDLKKYDIDCPFELLVRRSDVACHNMNDEDKSKAHYICFGTGLCGA